MKAWRRIFPLLLIVLLLFAASYSQDKIYRVKRVIDGDTLLLTNGDNQAGLWLRSYSLSVQVHGRSFEDMKGRQGRIREGCGKNDGQ